MKHEEIVRMLSQRASGKARRRVTDQDIEKWVEEETFERDHRYEMMAMSTEMSNTTTIEAVRPHGSMPEERSDGTFRGIMVQLNSMATTKVRNRKAALLQWLIRKYQIQIVGLGEVGVNWSEMKHGKRLLSLLSDIEQGARCSTAHNSRESERNGVHQQGGVGLIALDELISYYKKGSKDFRHLGRWDSVIIAGSQSHRTRIVQVYGVRPEMSQQLGSVCQQHIRYMQENDIQGVTPRELFNSDLLNQLRVWRQQGDRLIVMMDANENVLTGKLCRRLTATDIGLREITRDFIGSLCPYTYANGSQPIDGVWATEDITITAVKWLSFEESPGDHRACVFEFTSLSAIGTHEKSIVYPTCRRLASSRPESMSNYTEELKRQFSIHRMEERMDAVAADDSVSETYPPDTNHPADVIAVQTTEIQRHCERHCRKIYRPDAACSPEFSLWYKRCQIFSRMLGMVEGKSRNPGLLCKQARQLGIEKPRRWTKEEILHGRAIAKAWKRELRPEAPILRREHLSIRLVEAEANEDTERATAIRRMMDREENSTMWREIKYTMADNGGRSNAVTRVERIEDGEVKEYTDQADIERVVREETQERFSAASSSSLCKGVLGELLGNVSNTNAAAEILSGTFVPPEDTPESVCLLLEEISRISQLVRGRAVRLTCTTEEFQKYWKSVSEKTSSSASGVHFGHYIVAAEDDSLSRFFAKQISYITQTGRAPSRWGIGMNVLLEKIAGIALVNKLRAILLMEGDMNMSNKLIFGERMMEIARDLGLIPDEQFAEQQIDGQDGVFFKRLIADISRQHKMPIGIISADAANCYDRIAHPFASLVFQAFGVATTAVMSMLCTIQHMKFYLRTGFGESPGFMTALAGAIIHGLCQGNTASPAGWSVISAVLLAAYKRKNHGAHIRSPITGEDFTTAGVLYVDDVDLTTMAEDQDEEQMQIEAQESTTDWSLVLNDSGGTLKGETCFGYLAGFEWYYDGSWGYKSVPDIDLRITLPDGVEESIALLDVTVPRVTLGIATRPNGDDSYHLNAPGSSRDKWKSVRTRAETWLNRLQNGRLPPKHAWVSYRLQLWAGVRYGLGVLAEPVTSMGELAKNFAYRALPKLGVNRNIKTGWRYLHPAFSGCGLLDLGTESVISRLNMYLQHWDNPAPIGKSLRSSMEYLQLEIGCSGCPLQEPFSYMGEHCTHSWVRSFWECVDLYKLQLDVDYRPIPAPRENDIPIMRITQMLGYKGTKLESVNRCRIFTKSMFLSDVVNAAGNRLDGSRSGRNVCYSGASTYSFPITKPSESDWDEWDTFWKRYCLPDGTIPRSLGKWLGPSHKPWRWFHTEAEDTIFYRASEDEYWKYQPTGEHIGASTRRSYQYGRVSTCARPELTTLLPVSIEIDDANIVVTRLAGGPPLPDVQEESHDFWSHMDEYGGQWMWESVHNPKGLGPVQDAIRNGSAVLVTDGSYNRKIRSDLDSAGWVLYCRRRKKILLKCSFHEVCLNAGSYRGELLGLASIHIFLCAIERHYGCTVSERCLIACDNHGALNKAKYHRKKIPSGSKHADVRRVLRTAHTRLSGRCQYEHVYGHQDARKRWSDMTLLEQLNCKCDSLAKAALLRGITGNVQMDRDTQRLPMETAAVFHNNVKLNSDCGTDIRYHVGKKDARHFYLTELGWYSATFEAVDWESRDRVLSSTTDMFRIWLCKQCSTFCASGKNMGRWFGSEATQCPNCEEPQEDSRHLLHCPDPGRSSYLREEIKTVQSWLSEKHTDTVLGAALSEYISERGRKKLTDIVSPTRDVSLLRLAQSQDDIGWDHMMEGKVTKLLKSYQHNHLITSESMLTSDDWIAKFMRHLLHITHGQWIYRNVSRHHLQHGLLRDLERQTLLRDIDKYLSVSPEEVPEESKFLLEIDFRQIRTASTEKQSYWVQAMRAAIHAGRRVPPGRRRLRRRVASGASVSVSTAPAFADSPSIPFGKADDVSAYGGKPGSGSINDKSNKRRKPD